MNIPLYKQDGTQNGEVEVSEKIFGVKANKALIHKVLLLQLANRRHPIAHTLTKGEVSGGGKKPYAQKHTGRARQGSITNPHFRGGGVAFGPTNKRNFELRAPQKERQRALFGVLSEKVGGKHVSALDGYSADNSKTKEFALMLKKMPFKKNVLFVLPAKDEKVVRSSRNIPKTKTILVNYLNVADLLNFHDIVFFKDALPKLEEIFCA